MEAAPGWEGPGANCYAWAANCPNPRKGKPEPGRGLKSLKISSKYVDEALIEGVVADGMTLVSRAEMNPPDFDTGTYAVALYVNRTRSDFHWYRRENSTGFWTHKLGPQDPANFGAQGVILGKELHSVNHEYSSAPSMQYDFVAYFTVPLAGITVG